MITLQACLPCEYLKVKTDDKQPQSLITQLHRCLPLKKHVAAIPRANLHEALAKIGVRIFLLPQDSPGSQVHLPHARLPIHACEQRKQEREW